jgi:hypothetical protein
MKKFMKILAIAVLIILSLLFILPFAFRGKIMNLAKEEINSSLNAKADFDKLSLSLFRHFPNVSVSVKNLHIAGIKEFKGDTLFSARSIEVAVDLISAIKMENIRIKRIFVDKPRVFARILSDGRVNWDIVKETGTEPADTSTSDLNPKIELKQFEISDAFIRYDDDESKIYTTLKDVDFEMTGDLSQDFTTLSINSTTGLLNVVYEGVRYLKDASLTIDMDVDADLKKSLYTLKENSFHLNDLILNFDGTIGLPNDEDMVFDLKYGLEKTDFKSLLSLIPAIYMNDFANVKTSGELKLNGIVKGTYNEKSMPNVSLVMKVENAMFKYPDLPKSADHIGLDVNLFFDGVQNDNSTVDINKFHVELGGNPVDMTLNIKTPVSDMHLNGNLNMDLNLGTLTDVIPLDSTTLTGEIKAGLDFMGFVSDIEKEQYDKFRANGNVTIKDLDYSSPDLPLNLHIAGSSLLFSPQYLEVKNFDAVMGKSDFHVSGKMADFIPYVFKNTTIRGNFIFTSGVLDLNELMASSEAPAAETDTLPLTIIEVPGNIDFKLVSRIDKMFYDKLLMENTIGTILVKESRILLNGMRMNMLNGLIQLSGEYNTHDIKNPMVDLDFKASTIDIPSAFDAFTTLQNFAPIAQKAVGKVSISMKYSSYLDEHMMPLMKSIVGKGNFTSDLIGLKSSSLLDKIGNKLNTKAFSNLSFSNLGVNFEIRDGRLLVNPFEIKMGNTNMLIGGDQGIDQTMNYSIGITIPRSELGASANASIDNLISKATAAGLKVNPLETLNISVKVSGTFSDPKIGLDMKENSKQAKEEIKAQVMQAVQQQIDQKKEEAKAAAQAEIDKIMAEAQKQADAVRQKAAEAADMARNEANSNADKLVKKAKDPISKRLAEEAAKKVREEGEAGAQKIIKEGDAKADAILKSAKEQGDKLLAP